MVTLWTIQYEEAYRVFEKNGVLRANNEHLFCGDDLRFAYDWIASEMCKRIGPPPDGVQYPIWAWYQWEGQRKRRDCRYSGYGPRGTAMVQIEFEIDEKKFLLSDFDEWHGVLNDAFISDSEVQEDWFYNTHHEDVQKIKRNSWQKIFDLSRDYPDWTTTIKNKSIQATMWEIRWSQVKKVEHFIAK